MLPDRGSNVTRDFELLQSAVITSYSIHYTKLYEVIVLEGAFNFKIREDEGIKEIRTLSDLHKFVIDKLDQ